VEPVRTLAPDLHRRRRRDRQLDLAAELREPLLQLVRLRRVVPVELLAFGIAGGRAGGEVDLRQVALFEADEGGGRLRRATREEEEQAGGEGIERARVAGAGSRPAPHVRHDRERRRARGLVHEQDPRRVEAARRRHAPRAAVCSP
jgi:hypothetical protein